MSLYQITVQGMIRLSCDWIHIFLTYTKKRIIHDLEFEVFVDGTLVKKSGVYYLCDGSYRKWACIINPMKHTSFRDDRLWSEWVESTRKDVECLFGKSAIADTRESRCNFLYMLHLTQLDSGG